MSFGALLMLAACGRTEKPDDGVDSCDAVFYADADGDGHGDLAAPATACALPTGHATSSDDCDDADAEVHPGAEERCDGVDDDCDAAMDEDAIDASIWYADTDADGFGDGEATATACSEPLGFVGVDGDCADDDRDVHPGADELCNEVDDDCDGLADSLDPGLAQGTVWYDDDDGDGYGDPATGAHACEPPGDKVADGSDCDDAHEVAHPGADEVCDELDDDCDGLVDAEDDGLLDGVLFYADADGDGLGDAEVAVSDCAAPSGYVSDDQDCDDGDPKVGAALDYYRDPDRDGYGSGAATHTCDPTLDMIPTGGDCGGGDPNRYPGAPEVCDEVDNNCDGTVDEDDPLVVYTTFYADADGDGYGDAASTMAACVADEGFVSDALDCDDGDASVNPGSVEHCDGVDNDCDGSADVSVVYADWYADDDGDGYGDGDDSRNECVQPSGYVSVAGDCDDGAATAYPDAQELCGNDADDDCDGDVDDCAIDAADADLRIDGSTDNAGFAFDVAVADLDADGVSDIVTSEWNGDGKVFVLYGPATGVVADSSLVSLSATVSDASFGFALDGADVNGDGADDLGVSTSLWSTVNSAYLFLGPITADRDMTEAEAVFEGPSSTTVGNSLNIVGDVDGDGGTDLVIGAAYALSDRGTVYVASAATSGALELSTDATYVYEGDVADQIGWKNTSLGDTNGDGLTDLAIGARYRGAHEEGAVYVVEGGATSGTYDVGAAATATIYGRPDSDFGYALAAPDYDGDGTTDLLVGAFDTPSSAGSEAGAVYAFLGPLSGTLDTRNADVTWTGGADVGGLGIDVSVGDVDGDKSVDILMGAFWTESSHAGAAFLQFGLASGSVDVRTLPTIRGSSGEELGTCTALVPDWTGDEGAELVVGARSTQDAAGDEVGAVYVVFSDGLRF